MALGPRRAPCLRPFPVLVLAALLGQSTLAGTVNDTVADDGQPLFEPAATLTATSRGTSLSKLAPIVDPTGDASALCHDFECSGPQSACRDFPDRVCAWYAPCGHEACLHKQLLPVRYPDVQMLLAIFAVATLAGATGIGGGGVNVPLLMMLGGFDIKEAVPVSHVAVFGNALVQLFVNAPQRHPEMPQRPLIHHEMAWLMLPTMLGGNSLGIVVGKVFPPTLLVVLALVLLALTSTKTFAKGWAAMRKGGPAAQPGRGDEGGGSRPGAPSGAAAGALVEGGRGPEGDQGGHEGAAAAAAVRTPWRVVAAMLAFNVLFCLDYLVLSKDVSGVTACTAKYWAALLAIYPAALVAVRVAVRMLGELRRWHDQRGDGPVSGDPELNGAKVILFATAATVIGLVAGLLGLGGGEFMVPLLLEFGMAPRVAAATSGFVMVFTTSSNLMHYLAAGTMEPFLGYATSCFVVAGAGAGVGLLSRDRCMRQRGHLLVFLVAFILAFSGVLLALRAFVLDSGLDWSFGSFCH